MSVRLNDLMEPSKRIHRVFDFIRNPNSQESTANAKRKAPKRLAERRLERSFQMQEPSSSTTMRIFEPDLEPKGFYCMTEQCKADIVSAFQPDMDTKDAAIAVLQRLRQIFDAGFVEALESSDSSLVGKTVFLPNIFLGKVTFIFERMKFVNKHWISVTVTEEILNFIKYFSKRFDNICHIEGPVGIGKSYLLYFFVCYLMVNDKYWLAYIALPHRSKKMDHEKLSEFSNLYYPECMQEFPNFNFENSFGFGDYDSLDYPPNTKNKKFIFIIDQFNNFLHSYNKNSSFIDDILSENRFPRLILSGSANNDLELQSRFPKVITRDSKRFFCNPHVKPQIATEMIRNLLLKENMQQTSFNELQWGYFVQKVLTSTSSVPLQIQEFVADFMAAPEFSLSLIAASDNKSIWTFCNNLDGLASTFRAKLEATILSDSLIFQDKESNGLRKELLAKSNLAIIYSSYIKLRDILFDKRYFYQETEGPAIFKIMPIYDDAKVVLFDLLKKENHNCLADFENLIENYLKLNLKDYPTFGKLFEVYYWLFAQQNEKIPLMDDVFLPLDNVVRFIDTPLIETNKNTLFVPVPFYYEMYDFVLVAGRDSTDINVVFIQFTIAEKGGDKITETKSRYRTLESEYYDNILKTTVGLWLHALANLAESREFKFFELLISHQPSTEENDGSFALQSFGNPSFEPRIPNNILADLKTFLTSSSKKMSLR